MSTNVPGVTILPDTNNHFNGKNYASWKLQISELLKGKGLSGYIDGSITCLPIPVSATGAPPPNPAPMPIYSSVPSHDEWRFCDQLTHSHIVLNIIDLIGLGVKTDGTAKECWESVAAEHMKKSDMALSEAEQALNSAKFDGSSDIDLHVADLHTSI